MDLYNFDLYEEASKILLRLDSYFNEFTNSNLAPNTVLINIEELEIIKKAFPYLVKNNKFIYNNLELEICLSFKKTLGLAYSYFHDLDII